MMLTAGAGRDAARGRPGAGERRPQPRCASSGPGPPSAVSCCQAGSSAGAHWPPTRLIRLRQAAAGSAGSPRLRHEGCAGAAAREGPGDDDDDDGRRLQLGAFSGGSAASLVSCRAGAAGALPFPLPSPEGAEGNGACGTRGVGGGQGIASPPRPRAGRTKGSCCAEPAPRLRPRGPPGPDRRVGGLLCSAAASARLCPVAFAVTHWASRPLRRRCSRAFERGPAFPLRGFGLAFRGEVEERSPAWPWGWGLGEVLAWKCRSAPGRPEPVARLGRPCLL